MTLIVLEPKGIQEIFNLKHYQNYLYEVDTLKVYATKAETSSKMKLNKVEVVTKVESTTTEPTKVISIRSTQLDNGKLLTTLTDGLNKTKYEHTIHDVDALTIIEDKRKETLGISEGSEKFFRKITGVTDPELFAMLRTLTGLQVDKQYHKELPELLIIVTKLTVATTLITLKLAGYTLLITKNNKCYHAMYSKNNDVVKQLEFKQEDFARITKKFISNPEKETNE